MELIELMKARYSARKYTDYKPTAEQVEAIIEAGRISPSAKNCQPWRILVIQSDEGLAKVDECTPCRYNAQLAFLICYDPEVAFGNESCENFGPVDSSLCAMQMSLMAKEQGLDSVMVAMFVPEKTRQDFELPDNLVPHLFLMVGEGDMEPGPMHADILDRSETIFEESF